MVLELPPGYRREFPLRANGRDPNSICERATADTIAKAVVIDGKPTLMTIRFEGSQAVVKPARAKDVAVRLLGLSTDPRPFERRIARDPRLAPLLGKRRGLRVPQTANVFEGMVWAIVGQQVNLPFAFKLRRALAELAGTRVGELVAHPTPEQVARLDYHDLTSRQFSRRKAEYLIDTARLGLDFEALAGEEPAAVREKLLAIRGFGEWSANYVMMRACGFADCVPIGDSGLTASLQRFFSLERRPDAEQTAKLMQPFAPWRSLATFHFWMRLSESAM